MAQAAKMDFDRGGTMAEEEVDEGGGGSKKLIIIIVIVLVLLLGGAGAAYFFWFMPSGDESTETKGLSASEELVGEKEEDTRTGGADEKASKPAYFELNDPKKDNRTYTTNLMDGRRFIVVKLAAEYEMEEEKVNEYLEARRPLIDDIVLSYLSTLDSAAAQHRTARDTMKKQIKRKLNAQFNAEFMENYKGKGNPIKQIVIQKFILQ